MDPRHLPLPIHELAKLTYTRVAADGAPRPRRRSLLRPCALGSEHGWGCPRTGPAQSQFRNMHRVAYAMGTPTAIVSKASGIACSVSHTSEDMREGRQGRSRVGKN